MADDVDLAAAFEQVTGRPLSTHRIPWDGGPEPELIDEYDRT